jgi:hypothetical protein
MPSRRRDVACQIRVESEPSRQPLGQGGQGRAGVAAHEQVACIGSAAGLGVDVDLDAACRQGERLILGLVPAQPRAGDDQQVHGLEEGLDLRQTGAGGERQRMVLRNRAAAVPTADRRDAEIDQRPHGGRITLGPVADPEEWALRRRHDLGQRSERRLIGSDRRRPRQGQGIEIGRARDLGALDIDRDFDADRATRRRHRILHRPGQDAQRLARREDPVRGLADRGEHRRLAGHVVDRPHITVQHPGRRLSGDVEQRRSGEPRLDQGRHGIRRSRPGAGDQNAQPALHAGISVGHVPPAILAAGGDETDGVAAADGVQRRDVVHRDDAEHRLHLHPLQKVGDQVAHHIFFGHCHPPVGLSICFAGVWRAGRGRA